MSIETRAITDPSPALAGLREFLDLHERIAVLSGAGCSTASGIPDYRDDSGNWKHPRPVQFSEFVRSAAVRQRYWARSFAGWSRVASAAPNAAHVALARLEARGRVTGIITQNVDNLHRLAGSRNVVDLHGVLHAIRCLGCGALTSRCKLQERLEVLNADWCASAVEFAPDGDARLADAETLDFAVPDCGDCGGILKPDVVFFGEPVPAWRVAEASEYLQRADALLVVGSSLMVFSGFRFARMAHAAGMPLAILNRGATRADQLATYRLKGDCCSLLSAAVDRLTPGPVEPENAPIEARGAQSGDSK